MTQRRLEAVKGSPQLGGLIARGFARSISETWPKAHGPHHEVMACAFNFAISGVQFLQHFGIKGAYAVLSKVARRY